MNQKMICLIGPGPKLMIYYFINAFRQQAFLFQSQHFLLQRKAKTQCITLLILTAALVAFVFLIQILDNRGRFLSNKLQIGGDRIYKSYRYGIDHHIIKYATLYGKVQITRDNNINQATVDLVNEHINKNISLFNGRKSNLIEKDIRKPKVSSITKDNIKTTIESIETKIQRGIAINKRFGDSVVKVTSETVMHTSNHRSQMHQISIQDKGNY